MNDLAAPGAERPGVVEEGHDPPQQRLIDPRSPLLGVGAWAAAIVQQLAPAPITAAVLGLTLVVAVLLRRRRFAAVLLLVAVAVGAASMLRTESHTSGPIPALATSAATGSVQIAVTTDPVRRQGRFSDYVVLRGTVREVTGRGHTWQVRTPVLVIADESWSEVKLGSVVRSAGRFARADDDVAAVFNARGEPRLVRAEGWPWRAADRLRTGVREAVTWGSPEARALVPALVDGDDGRVGESVQEDFRETGLTHLLAVSGTNLTIVVGALLVLTRGLGVRGRGLIAVGAVGVVAFVLLARPQPSVLRAAVMGSVALIGMGADGRQRGPRAWGIAVLVLMLFVPSLALDAGFALSALATAGILFLAPRWRDAMLGWFPHWLPRWVSEAIAVPAAAQLACTPLVAAISGRISVVAVVANMVVEPVVAPATVLGVLGGCLSAIAAPIGRPVGWLACLAASWLIEVAHRFAHLPTASIGWPTSPFGLFLLTAGCGWAAVVLGRVFSRRIPTVLTCLSSVLLVFVQLPTPGWPPENWAMVVCDVGQGDALVLNAGRGSAVVVDTGPDPALMDRCLRRLGVSRVPLVVLTHFHADHIGGLAGVLDGREVAGIEVTDLADPLSGSRQVHALAAAAKVPARMVRFGERASAGPVRWQVLAPSGPPPSGSASPPNDASIVMYVETQGISLLLTGDQETEIQQRLAPIIDGTKVDVLKVAHHGSAKQDPELVRGLGARLAVISVGKDNDYGHPAPRTLKLLEDAGMLVRRTDQSGDIAVIAENGRLSVRTRR